MQPTWQLLSGYWLKPTDWHTLSYNQAVSVACNPLTPEVDGGGGETGSAGTGLSWYRGKRAQLVPRGTGSGGTGGNGLSGYWREIPQQGVMPGGTYTWGGLHFQHGKPPKNSLVVPVMPHRLGTESVLGTQGLIT
ncbi:hypothetical protein XENTR_v10013054 [Xenopus tropicalis]|nr:hypothetical protein XENTR_v10013054 [Xenopus tropicalis]